MKFKLEQNFCILTNTMTPAQSTDIVALQNPFLDPFNIPKGGSVVKLGQPLSKIQVPNIQTLVYKTAELSGNLAVVDVSEALNKAGITPREPVLFKDETVGIELNISLFGAPPSTQQTQSDISPAITTGQTIGRRIPNNYREARDMLHLITAQRTGSKNIAFNINELKQIAKNLHLQANGNKDALAARIRTAVIELFNLQKD